MPYATFLFDLDGTLIDSTDLILSSFRHTRRVHFGDERPDAEYVATFGMPLRAALHGMTDSDEHAEALVHTYLTFNLQHHDSMVRAHAGVRSALEQLREKGHRLVVVTSKLREHAWRGLRVSGLVEFFDTLIGGDDVTRGKPHPEPVLRALEAAGAPAGVATAAVAWGSFPRAVLAESAPSHWLEHPAELGAL